MKADPVFVSVDPVTDDVLWVCAGPGERLQCRLSEKPPYVCQGLKLIAAQRTGHDGSSFLVEEQQAFRCSAARLYEDLSLN